MFHIPVQNTNQQARSFPHINTMPNIRGSLRFGDDDCVHDGQHTEVFKGRWTDVDGVTYSVAVRVMNANRVFLAGLDKTLERLSRQFAVWSTLNHPNVARLLGKTTHTRDSELFWGVPCIISRWYEGRTLARYVTKTKRNDPLGYFYGRADAMIERLELVRALGDGLRYLHRNNVVHGDLCPGNVIIDRQTHQPVIIDFGFSRFVSVRGFTSNNGPGNVRYRAPRLEDANRSATLREARDTSNATGSRPGDVWSFAMVALKVMSLREPYHEFGTTDDQRVYDAIRGAKRHGIAPNRLHYELLHDRHLDMFWSLLEGCWRGKYERLDMESVVGLLDEILSHMKRRGHM